MVLEGIVWKLYDIANWVMKMIYLNILWISFSVLGLVVFGFFPATAAMFAVTRKWILGEKDISIFKIYLEAFKSSFIQTNIIGSVLLILGLFLYIDLRFFQTSEQVLLSFLAFFIIFALFIYFAVVLYIFPMYAHFEFKTLEYIKRSIIMVLGKPVHTVMMIVGSYLVYVIISMMPLLLLFLSGSLFSLVIMWIAMKSFPKYEIKVGEAK